MSATLHTNGHLSTMGLPVVDFARIEQAAITAARTLKNVALFAAAPFIGLVYAMALPLVGLVMLATIAARAVARTNALATLKNVGLLAAAPFIGLAYAVALPFVGSALVRRGVLHLGVLPSDSALRGSEHSPRRGWELSVRLREHHRCR